VADPRAEQLRLALGPYVNRKLFSDHFLKEILPTWPEFAEVDSAGLLGDLAALWTAERNALVHANEAQTEERFIKPVLRRLGFSFTVQAGIFTASGHRQPDYALFVDDLARAAAEEQAGAKRFARAVAVGDAKRFDRPLDQRRVAGELSEDPVAQIIHYIAVTRTRWGILTNGRLWRLYAAEGDLVEGACLEVDLCALLDAGDPEAFRYFASLFAASGLAPDTQGRSFLDRALAGSRAQAIAVGDALRQQVFGAVPLVAEGLLSEEHRTTETLAAAFDNSLVVLYRVLFCLHAEDRSLLPVDNPHYLQYSLRQQRDRLAHDLDSGRIFSTRSDDLFNDLRALFRIIDQGDPALAVNEYNGGLFAAGGHPWLHGRTVPDSLLAPAMDLLYRVDGKQVDYRDLSVRHLGTIFEQLLAFQLKGDEAGKLVLEPAGGRKATGAYFTPEHIVDDIVERTLGPIVDRRSGEIANASAVGRAAFGRLLDIHVVDPAMGSGHFLVSAAAYLARRIANDPSYDEDYSLPELQGIVAERCLYGVDVNPMAVEIARLALWLSTVRSDQPLRFLANLRHGNSLVSCDLSALLGGGETLFASELAGRAREMLDQISVIAATDTRSGEEAHKKEKIQTAVEALKEPFMAVCNEAVSPPVDETTGGRPLHWEIEFPERFLTNTGELLSNRGFDAVIGNPPYVRIQALGRDLADYCRKRYQTASGAFDAFIPFIERGVQLLRRDGTLGFIVPNKFLKNNYGTRMRGYLARGRFVSEIIDFGHAQVFDGATNYTCITILDRQGRAELDYVAVRGNSEEVRRAVAAHQLPAAERYVSSELDESPWLLLPRGERQIVDTMCASATTLGEVTSAIFTGLQTSADAVYIVESRGVRSGYQVVRTSDGEEHALEPDLLHEVASGTDVGCYAFEPLKQMVLFPYQRRDGAIALISEAELRALPRTWEYLCEREAVLRGRERGKMDHDGWWAYVYPKSLDLQDHPKLGVPRLCRRLRASIDDDGAVFLDNVDVNGIIAAGERDDLLGVAALLNSRALDYVFRRGSVPFQSGFFSANKQFIELLPVPQILPSEVSALGKQLYELQAAAARERGGLLDWLASVLGARIGELAGSQTVVGYATSGVERVLDVLDSNARRLTIDPRRRAERERIGAEIRKSIGILGEIERERAPLELAADVAIYDAFGLSGAQRSAIDAEFDLTAPPAADFAR